MNWRTHRVQEKRKPSNLCHHYPKAPKIRHETRFIAEREAARLGRSRVEVEAFRCEHCRGWHTGKRPPAETGEGASHGNQ